MKKEYHDKINILEKRIKNIENMFNDDKNNILLKIINNIDIEKINNTVDNDIRKLLLKKVLNFYNVIQILDGKLIYLKSGSSGHTFKSIQSDENKSSYCVKVVAYPKKKCYGDIFNSTRPENVEILVLSILSYFVINKQTPHIVLPITTFNTNIDLFINLYKRGIVVNDKYKNFVTKYDNNEYYNNVSILISEWADGGDLLDYLKKNYKCIKILEWKTLFFQIISTLAIIQSKYPAFRHNDLKANNILINKTFIKNNNKKYNYNINNISYIIPYIGYQIKIWDFDFACIENITINSKVESEWAKNINITSTKHRYYYIHYFFNTLLKKGFLPEIINKKYIPIEVIEFINRVVPEKYRTSDNTTSSGRLLCNDEYLIPDDIIKNDSFFNLFRKQLTND